MPIAKKTFYIFMAAVLILMAWLCIFHPDWIVAGPPKAGALGLSDKGDGDCPTLPAYATVGRCADKCPDWSYTQLGFDSNGRAICQAPAPAVYNDANANDQAPADTFAGK